MESLKANLYIRVYIHEYKPLQLLICASQCYTYKEIPSALDKAANWLQMFHTKVKKYLDRKNSSSVQISPNMRNQDSKRFPCPVAGKNQILQSCLDQPARKTLWSVLLWHFIYKPEQVVSNFAPLSDSYMICKATAAKVRVNKFCCTSMSIPWKLETGDRVWVLQKYDYFNNVIP